MFVIEAHIVLTCMIVILFILIGNYNGLLENMGSTIILVQILSKAGTIKLTIVTFIKNN